MDKVLEIRQLRKNYGQLTALQNLSLSIPKGSIYGLLGPNGSGKTTTLAMLLGVLNPSAGDFQWFGQDLSFPVKRRIGAILETPNFYPYLTALQNLKLVAEIKELKDPNYSGILEKVGLLERQHSKFKTFSLGMKQRLAIASALLSEPEVLILDEPTNGLDPSGIAEVRQIILDIAQSGITVLMASHLLVEVEKICTHVAVLRRGELLYDGPVGGLQSGGHQLELAAEDGQALQQALRQVGIDFTTAPNQRLLLPLKEGQAAADINRLLSQKGIYLSHLVEHQSSLEENFINLIKTPSRETL